MGFFDQPARVRHSDSPGERPNTTSGGVFGDEPHTGWVAGVIPRQFVLARSAGAAVIATNITVLPDEFNFMIEARVRHLVPGGLDEDGPWFDPYRYISSRSALPDHVLRFGVQFSDGESATNSDAWLDRPGTPRPPHGLRRGRSDGRRVGDGLLCRWEYSAWPLPEEGELSMVCQWPAYGIEQTHHRIPAEEFHSALRHAEELWPEHR